MTRRARQRSGRSTRTVWRRPRRSSDRWRHARRGRGGTSRRARAARSRRAGRWTLRALAGASRGTRAARAQLNSEEIEASSQPPRDDLNAPLVGGRDFVTERIRLDLANAQHWLVVAERALATADRRVRVGAVSDLARAEAQL